MQHFFPSARVLRMDRDTTQQKDAHLRILSAFKRHEADILIGTQMITKGLDFPQVTLVGIIAADASLHVPDYRSAERTFCLITQVAGRAGRDAMPGEVYLQTYSPEHPAVRCAARHDYESFYHYEIGVRRDCRFPPFADFIRFLFESEDYAQAKEPGRGLPAAGAHKMQRLLAEQNLPPVAHRIRLRHARAHRPDPRAVRFQLLVKLARAPGSELLKAQLLALARERRKEGALFPRRDQPAEHDVSLRAKYPPTTSGGPPMSKYYEKVSPKASASPLRQSAAFFPRSKPKPSPCTAL